VRVAVLEARDLRNLREVQVELEPGLNVFVGRNAQGKTSVLEAVALLSRARSFRTEDVTTLVRRGTGALRARGRGGADGWETTLEVEIGAEGRRLRVDGRDVAMGAFVGRLDVVVYSTERLRIVRGPMRERRHFLDRGAAALWPSYRQLLRQCERVIRQRNAALEARSRDLEAWDEQLVELGAALRHRRAVYVDRLRAALRCGLTAAGEAYDVRLSRQGAPRPEAEEREILRGEIRDGRGAEQGARRTLVGPHRDVVCLSIAEEEVSQGASSGQARSLLLALTLAALEVYGAERGHGAVALLDDLDSELDQERAFEVCRFVVARGQALVTTAHEPWARSLGEMGRVFEVSDGRVRAA
jgi:DNA replication and repair protein RecF